MRTGGSNLLAGAALVLVCLACTAGLARGMDADPTDICADAQASGLCEVMRIKPEPGLLADEDHMALRCRTQDKEWCDPWAAGLDVSAGGIQFDATAVLRDLGADKMRNGRKQKVSEFGVEVDALVNADVSNKVVAEGLGLPMANQFLAAAAAGGEKYHGLIVAFGATGTGKTYTMGLSANVVKKRIVSAKSGVFPTIVKGLFAGAAAAPTYYVRVYELYVGPSGGRGDTVVDLMKWSRLPRGDVAPRFRVPQNRKTLEATIQAYPVTSEAEMSQQITAALLKRVTSATNGNSVSSRSHLFIEIMDGYSGADEAESSGLDLTTYNSLTLVDLAGNENAATNVKKDDDHSRSRSVMASEAAQQLQEGIAINQSLMEFKSCIRTGICAAEYGLLKVVKPYLNDVKKKDFRMIFTVSPAVDRLTQTTETMKFVQACAKKKSSVKRARAAIIVPAGGSDDDLASEDSAASLASADVDSGAEDSAVVAARIPAPAPVDSGLVAPATNLRASVEAAKFVVGDDADAVVPDVARTAENARDSVASDDGLGSATCLQELAMCQAQQTAMFTSYTAQMTAAMRSYKLDALCSVLKAAAKHPELAGSLVLPAQCQ